MPNPADDRTSPTLLGRLRNAPNDPTAWRDFVARYGPVLYRWGRHWGLTESDAEDVTQNVMLDLAKQMQTFEYRESGRFRAWLKTIARRAWCDFITARQRQASGSGDTAVGMLLNSVPAADDLLVQFDRECEREMYEAASILVKLRVEPVTWNAFQLTVMEDLSGADAAQRLGISVASVYQAKSRIQKLLQEEIERFDRGEG